jgi:hypothetical protein
MDSTGSLSGRGVLRLAKKRYVMTATYSHTEEITVPLALLNRITNQSPTFDKMSYAEMVADLDSQYQQLRVFMSTPASISYGELAALRRRAVGPETANAINHRFQPQLKLATDLLRLGRRTEGLALLKSMEDRVFADENRRDNLCYVVWAAMLRVIIGDKQGAFNLASQITFQATDATLDTRVLNFFFLPLAA